MAKLTSDQTANLLKISNFKHDLNYLTGRAGASSLAVSLENLDHDLQPESTSSPFYGYKDNPIVGYIKEGDTAGHTYSTFQGQVKNVRSEEEGRTVKVELQDYIEKTKNISSNILMDVTYQNKYPLNYSDLLSLLSARVPIQINTTGLTATTTFFIAQPEKLLLSVETNFPTMDRARGKISEGNCDLIYDEVNNCIFYIARRQGSLSILDGADYARTDHYNSFNSSARLLQYAVASKTLTDITTSCFTTGTTYLYAIARSPDTSSDSFMALYTDYDTGTAAESAKIRKRYFKASTLTAQSSVVVYTAGLTATGSYDAIPYYNGHFRKANTAQTTYNCIISLEATRAYDDTAIITITPDDGDNTGWGWVFGRGIFRHLPSGLVCWDGLAYKTISANDTPGTGTEGDWGKNFYIPISGKYITSYVPHPFNDDNKEDEWKRMTSTGCRITGLPYPWRHIDSTALGFQSKVFLIPRMSEFDATWWNIEEAIELKTETIIPRGWYAMLCYLHYSVLSADRTPPCFHIVEMSQGSNNYNSNLYRPQLKIDTAGNTFVGIGMIEDIDVANKYKRKHIYGQVKTYILDALVENETAMRTHGGGLLISHGYDNGDPAIYFTGMDYNDGSTLLGASISHPMQQNLVFCKKITASWSDAFVVRKFPKNCSVPIALTEKGDLIYPVDDDVKEIGQGENFNTTQGDTTEDSNAFEIADYNIISTVTGSKYENQSRFQYEIGNITINDTTYMTRRFLNADEYSDMGDLWLVNQTYKGKSCGLVEGCISNIASNKAKNKFFWVDRAGWLWQAKTSWNPFIHVKGFSYDLSVNDLLVDIMNISNYTLGNAYDGDLFYSVINKSATAVKTLSACDCYSFPKTRDLEEVKTGVKINLATYYGESIEFINGLASDNMIDISIKTPVPEMQVRHYTSKMLEYLNKNQRIIELETRYWFNLALYDKIMLDLGANYNEFDGAWYIVGMESNPETATLKLTLYKVS